jgi:hypothetical protein
MNEQIPIGKFEYKSLGGEWVSCPPVVYFDHVESMPNYYRFRANTGLKDANSEWWYDGDEGWYGGKKFTVGLERGIWFAQWSDKTRSIRLYLYKCATRTPPVKMFRRIGEYNCCHEAEITWVEDERKGERRTKQRRAYTPTDEGMIFKEGQLFGNRRGDRRKEASDAM